MSGTSNPGDCTSTTVQYMMIFDGIYDCGDTV
jgi:hypothetical protein